MEFNFDLVALVVGFLGVLFGVTQKRKASKLADRNKVLEMNNKTIKGAYETAQSVYEINDDARLRDVAASLHEPKR